LNEIWETEGQEREEIIPKKRRGGCEINSTPMLTLFFSPPLIPLTIVFPIRESAHFFKLNSSNTFYFFFLELFN